MMLDEHDTAHGVTGPSVRRGRSKQNYGTPPEFLEAVKRDFALPYGFACDLAAEHENTVSHTFITKEQDSLSSDQRWYERRGALWLNPPFDNITPWVKKACEESALGARVYMLIPASVGANWWRDWVHEKAGVHFLNGRIKFVGATDPYPKDCALLTYERNRQFAVYNVWTWRDGTYR